MRPFLRTLIALWMAAHAALAGAHGDLVRTDDLPPAKSQSSASTGGADHNAHRTWRVPTQLAQGHAAHNHSSAGKVVDEWVDGEIRQIDRGQGKISIRHGEIRSLDMPPMTMVFDAAQPSLLDGLSPGERIRFRLTVEGDRYQVTAVERR